MPSLRRASEIQLPGIPPGGKAGDVLARMFGEDPETEIRESLRQFKAVMETGSPSASTEGRTGGRRGS